MDAYAWLFAMLVDLDRLRRCPRSRYDMSPGDPAPRFFSSRPAFMGAMLGTVLSGNLIQLVVFWELDQPHVVHADRLPVPLGRRTARRANGAHRDRRRAAFVCLLGVLMLGDIVGSYDLDRVLGSRRRDPRRSLGTGRC